MAGGRGGGNMQSQASRGWRLMAVAFAFGAFVCVMPHGPAAAASPAPGGIDDWAGHGRTGDEQRFSPLTGINAGNVGRLGLVWSLDLPGEHTLEATPLEVQGVIYFSGGLGRVYAVDATSGRLLWKYEPQTNVHNARDARIIFGANRGVAYADGRVFVALKDGWMVALDAATGKVEWSARFLLPGDRSASSGAPRAFRGRVIIGNSGAEFGARGYVTTLDAKTGRVLWRFFVVPGDPAKGPDHAASDEVMAMAARTWSGDWWKYGGGGTPWNAITYDEELNQIYVGTGNGGPWNSRFRSDGTKDNLFLTSVIALDADTGRYKWHYQYNPQDSWDYKATADIILADLEIDGVPRKVLMQAPTNGFFYVIDRHTGKLISAEKLGKVTWAAHRPCERATGRTRGHPLREGAFHDVSGRMGRSQLASLLLQSAHGIGVHPLHANGHDVHAVRGRGGGRAGGSGEPGTASRRHHHAVRRPERSDGREGLPAGVGPGGAKIALARGPCVHLEPRHHDHRGQPRFPGVQYG